MRRAADVRESVARGGEKVEIRLQGARRRLVGEAVVRCQKVRRPGAVSIVEQPSAALEGPFPGDELDVRNCAARGRNDVEGRGADAGGIDEARRCVLASGRAEGDDLHDLTNAE